MHLESKSRGVAKKLGIVNTTVSRVIRTIKEDPMSNGQLKAKHTKKIVSTIFVIENKNISI